MPIARVTNKAPALPSRVAIYGPEKFGKTSFAAQAPSPVFLLSPGENGLLSLIEANRIPPTDHFPECQTWDGMLTAVRDLRDQDHTFRSAVFDTANGMELLCAAHTCENAFGGNWGDYNAYGRG